MNPSLQAALDVALEVATQSGADYAEARSTVRDREVINFKDGEIDGVFLEDDRGVGVRVLVGNGWGFASTNQLTSDALASAARAAVTAARAAMDSTRPAIEVPSAFSGTYDTLFEEDPLQVPLAEKLETFREAHGRIIGAEGIIGARGNFIAQRTQSRFGASNGSQILQNIVLCGGGLMAIAMVDGEVQTRSAPKSHEGNVLQGGYEHFRSFDLVGEAARVRDEALALTRSPVLPSGETTLILDGSQLSLQIHESVGHPSELDRALGEEISLAGASFLLPEQLGTLQFGSEHVTLTADGTTPLGPGTFGFDDEGTPARRTVLVDRGRFVGYLSGRDSAARLGLESGGAMRAESWAALPIVRMVNVNLEPGQGSLADLIGGVEQGYLFENNKSWSIDDLRLNFQFSCEIAREIKNGTLTGRIFRNPVYSGVTPNFWRRCSGIAGPEEWAMWGWMFCGKGDPIQIMHVGHGCAPARFERVRVGLGN